MRKLINHIKRWNKWRKGNLNGRFYKFSVLIGVTHSPTFALTLTDEEEREIRNMMDKILKGTEPIVLIPAKYDFDIFEISKGEK